MATSYLPSASSLYLFVVCLLLSTHLWTVNVCNAAPVGSVTMRVVNHAGAPIELYWIDTFTPKKTGKTEPNLVKQTTKPIRNNSDTSINSYNTHEFLVRFLTPIEGAEARFAKGPREEVVTVTYDPDTNTMTAKQTTKFDEIMDTIKGATTSCGESDLRGEAFSACVANAVIDDVNRLTDSKARLQKYRDAMSSRLRNLTCADDTMNTTKPIDTKKYEVDGKLYDAQVLLDLPGAKIWYIENFITDEECDVLKKHGGPKLRRATVAAEDGTSIVSENRKANQASYNLHQKNRESDPLWPLFNRVLAITNSHTGLRLKPDGQEDFTIIQYNVADQYTPHCDGTCDNTMHLPGGRVATAVLYCHVAERGGGTTFTKADVFVKPVKGMVTFFSYKDVKDGRMDEGYTEHSGCPVLEGEKWITTMWMRDGVSAAEPWTMFDPNGVRMMTPEEQMIADKRAKIKTLGEEVAEEEERETETEL